MRGVKKVTLRLIETFVDKCEDTALIASQFVPPMTDPILGDYARNVPDARCAAWLPCCIANLGHHQGNCACNVAGARCSLAFLRASRLGSNYGNCACSAPMAGAAPGECQITIVTAVLTRPRRDAEVLSVFAAIISKLREAMADKVPIIFEAVFECTLHMITKNFEVGGPLPAHICSARNVVRSVFASSKDTFRWLLQIHPFSLQRIASM